MNAINGKEEVDSVGVYGGTDTILCAHPECKETFKFSQKYPSKKYHAKECKNAHHRMERVVGQKVLARGKIKAALLENSPRLQRVARFLSDGKPHSTREIIKECDVCAVNSIVDELRDPKNGFDIICKQVGRECWKYRMVGGQSQLLRIAQ